MKKPMMRSESEEGVEVREARRVYRGRHPLTVASDGTVHMGAANAVAYEHRLDPVERRVSLEYAR